MPPETPEQRRSARPAQRAQTALASVRALATSGVIRPNRPRRLFAAGDSLRHWGVNYAGGFAAAAARFPDRTCVIDGKAALTWSSVDEQSNAMANALRASGVRAGDVVAVLCRNNSGFVVVTAALAKLGTHVLLANTGFAGPQLVEVLEREQARLLICDQEFLHLVTRPDGSTTVDIVLTDSDATNTQPSGLVATVPDLIANGDGRRPAAPTAPGRMVILTSGTTGTPKGASRPQATGLGTAAAIFERIPYRSGDTTVLPAPLFHAWGFANLGLALMLGSTMVLRPRFDPEQTLADIAEHRARVLVAVPVMLQRICELPDDVIDTYDTSSLEAVVLSGSALPGALATRWMDRFGDNLYNLYGSTEVGWATIATPADLRADPATAGRPPINARLRIVDEAGNDVPVGTSGRIFVGSPLLFDGYTNGDTKEVLEGFMSTGDTGYLDAAGRLRIEGRSDDMIVSGGENVYPREVEELIERMPGVNEAVVVGAPDDEFGQRLVAYVVPSGTSATPTAEEIRQHVASTLARYKVPRQVTFIDELPRNATGKVLRNQL
jgi:acyl-CoA synthetase (AMP-forming)/AMP-acid ligase II